MKRGNAALAIIGIDLGTTNSLGCVWKDGKIQLIPNRFGSYLTPSVVSVMEDGGFFFAVFVFVVGLWQWAIRNKPPCGPEGGDVRGKRK